MAHMRKITLTKGKHAIVDDKDFVEMTKFKWHYSEGPPGYGYARRSVRVGGKIKGVRMHRVIMGAKQSEDVDHINGNCLDNRLSNLYLKSRPTGRRRASMREL